MQRRAELVEAAIRAIRKHGASVGMDEIAAEAGTSKTVIYRHLGDRTGLYLAVCEVADGLILGDFEKALHAGGMTDALTRPLPSDVRPLLVAVIDSYLRLVERDPELYRFVVRRPLLDTAPDHDPIVGLTDAIADRLAGIFTAALTGVREDAASAARLWSHGLIGFVRESADRWLAESPDERPSREQIVGLLAEFAAGGLTGVLGLPDPHLLETSQDAARSRRTTL